MAIESAGAGGDTSQLTPQEQVQLTTATRAASNPLYNPSVQPTSTNANQSYQWIGGQSTGQWQLYNNPTASTSLTSTGSASGALAGLTAAAGTSTSALASGTGPTSANAAAQLAAVLTGYGLSGNIASGITALMQNGLDQTTITTILDSNDPASAIAGLNLQGAQLNAANNLVSSWETRFSGNIARVAAGLQPLDPATYIANEQSYKQVMSMAGIPQSSAMMQTDYLGKLMAADVSPAEVQMRVSAATSAIQNEDPAVIAQLQSQYGLSQSSILTHLLDPTVAAPVIQQEVNAANIGAAASRVGANIAFGNVGDTGQNGLTAMQLAAMGVTQSQAQSAFQTIATQQPALQGIANRYGAGIIDPNQVGAAEQAQQFGTSVSGISAAQAQAQLNRLNTQEVSAFSGSAGAATGSLGLKDVSGLM